MRYLRWVPIGAGLILIFVSSWALLRGDVGLTLVPSTPTSEERLVPTVPPGAELTPYYLLITSSSPTPTAEIEATLPAATMIPGMYSIQQRFGVGVPLPPPDRHPGFASLGVGWYIDWHAQMNPSPPTDVEYVQMVRLMGNRIKPEIEIIQSIAKANIGSLWLVGNEPDVIWQDSITPDEYAVAYQQVYQAVKEADPTAQVAIGGISQPTPLRLQYLEAVLVAYRDRFGVQVPVDVWNVHNFILREERGSWGVDIPPGMEPDRGILYGLEDNDNIDAFRSHVLDFRRWMKEHGFRDKPLIISEYGIPLPEYYGYTYERVRDFMYQTFDFLLYATDDELGYPADGNRLVQRWCWYSLVDIDYPTGNLVDIETGSLLPLGIAFAKYIRSHR